MDEFVEVIFSFVQNQGLDHTLGWPSKMLRVVKRTVANDWVHGAQDSFIPISSENQSRALMEVRVYDCSNFAMIATSGAPKNRRIWRNGNGRGGVLGGGEETGIFCLAVFLVQLCISHESIFNNRLRNVHLRSHFMHKITLPFCDSTIAHREQT